MAGPPGSECGHRKCSAGITKTSHRTEDSVRRRHWMSGQMAPRAARQFKSTGSPGLRLPDRDRRAIAPTGFNRTVLN
jgi:hypothetical protein